MCSPIYVVYGKLSVCVIPCTVLVAEVTQPSLGVGYEIGRAVDMNKKILCLYRPQPNKRVTS